MTITNFSLTHVGVDGTLIKLCLLLIRMVRHIILMRTWLILLQNFKNILGHNSEVCVFPDDVVLPSLSEIQASALTNSFTEAEVFNTMKKMSKNRSLGPDGFPSEFYLSTWHIFGPEVTNDSLYFFDFLKLPRIVNAAAICLVPKVQNSSEMKHFRPISIVL